MKKESDSQTHTEIRYAHGYDSEQSRRMHGGRTAQVHGAFFLPHVRVGMKLLDCGCGSGSITLGLADVVAPGQVTGIDIASSELERARTSANQQGFISSWCAGCHASAH